MSNHLAIATVTAAFRQVIEDEVTGILTGAQVEVTHVRPGGEPPLTPTTGVNLFLYGVSPNPHWRNSDLPTRRSNGTLVQRPQAALDLHYLVSCYGDDKQLETQRLLGGVVRAIHARPALTREKLREVARSNVDVLGQSDLADAVEVVRFTLVPLSLEELSKLWSVLFQTSYALSVVYQASMVLVEADTTPAPSLPTRARTVYVVPFRQVLIEEVSPQSAPRAPIVATSTLSIRGRGLRGDVTQVRIGRDLVEPAIVTDREVVVPLSAVPADRLRAGVRAVQVVHDRLMGSPLAPHKGEESNVAAIVLRPSINRLPEDPLDPELIEHDIALIPAVDEEPAKLRVALTPQIGERQRALLLLNRIAPPAAPPVAYALSAGARDEPTDTLDFDASGVESGTYVTRVQVDGAESLLLPDDSGAYAHPQVTVP